MKLADKIGKGLQFILPSPFSIALILTAITFLLAAVFGQTSEGNKPEIIELFQFWENGLWNSSLLAFAVQMMLMLVLGHCLALSPPISKLIDKLVDVCGTGAKTAALVSFFTLLVSFFNWGLGLVFGAILARKIAERAELNNIKINYALVGAAAYSGFMIWHSGISGSATSKVAEKGHLKDLMEGLLPAEQLSSIPESIAFDQTVFSSMNLILSLLAILLIPATVYFLAKRSKVQSVSLSLEKSNKPSEKKGITGADKFDHSTKAAKVIGSLIILYLAYKSIILPENLNFKFLNPNFINLSLFGLALVFHKNIFSFLGSVDKAIGGAAPILIQFPLYFGIMGLMKDAGLIQSISSYFVEISGPTSYPLLTFFSAGLVNIFVPSGGGQWAVQGPLIVHAALAHDIPLSKCIMALCYGDQLTNMLQPFWALPILGITGLKAKEILPYTLVIMLVGMLIFGLGLVLF